MNVSWVVQAARTGELARMGSVLGGSQAIHQYPKRKRPWGAVRYRDRRSARGRRDAAQVASAEQLLRDPSQRWGKSHQRSVFEGSCASDDCPETAWL